MKQKMNLFIISPSSYYDNGRLLQYYRILMRSSAPMVLKSLALNAAGELGVQCSVITIDERLERGEDYIQEIKWLSNEETLVFITTKSFELPRGIDIAIQLRRAGFKVFLGGPGVTLTDWRTYEFMINQGLSINVGEGELTVRQIISDFLNGKLKKFYWQREYVDLSKAPLPALSERKEHRGCLNPLVGISTSEGCPFNCSYCCIESLRGKNISLERSRDPYLVAEWIFETHRRGLPIMLTDDNLRRSYHYEMLKELLTQMNEKQRRKFEIFIQMDVAPGILEEIPYLAKMGVTQVFLGMETLDSKVLRWMKKSQNHPEEYLRIAQKFREYGILVNSGVMIGFPPQTPATIAAEIGEFIKILDSISLNIVTPLPGSRDYKRTIEDGTILTFDTNFYDMQHCCRDWSEKTTPTEIEKAFDQALMRGSTLKHRLAGRSKFLQWRNIKNTFYARFLAVLGLLMRGRPYYYMMNGIPCKANVFRPCDGYHGFPLTIEDLAKRESYLESLV